ncbi:ABC transporter ATP-binding protein [Rossellomorea marisflavi]|uniref:ABC transporter ATP-binding protein n=1 Tax=Rossellomorea marisflavi TaxID=189381 RepID=UPI003D2EA57C
MTLAIEVNGVSKTIKKREIISNVSMKVRAGEIYGFLGPNGAGKTTIMRMMLNLVKPTAGTISMNGEVVDGKSAYLKEIGSIIEYPVFYERLTVEENLVLHCRYMGIEMKDGVDRMLEKVGLKGAKDQLISELSLGMKQRLGIARAIIHQPRILILDEPINGLDPIGIREVRELLLMLKEQGMTILISSHIVSEIESIADTIGVIQEGRLISEVRMEELKEGSRSGYIIGVKDAGTASQILSEVGRVERVDDRTIIVFNSVLSRHELNRLLVVGGVEVERIERKESNLEDYFINLLKEGKRHA